MPVMSVLWKRAIAILAQVQKRHPAVSRIYVRHSAATGPQNLLLSDIDLTVFVDADSPERLAMLRERIGADLNSALGMGHITRDRVFLPSSEVALNLCRDVYPFRALYPMQSWLLVPSTQGVPAVRPRALFPLDHTSENFLYTYLLPA